MLTNEEIQILIKLAQKSRQNAFLIYKDHAVGASVLSSDGFYFGGCNIESIIFGLGSCAEKVAINSAVVKGKFHFKALAVYDTDFTYPCGSCLQYLYQFQQVNDQEIKIIVCNEKEEFKITSLKKLLPKPYHNYTQIEKLHSYQKK